MPRKMYQEVNMKTLFYTASVLMIVVWAVSYFVYGINTSIHFLLLVAVLLGLAGFIEKKE